MFKRVVFAMLPLTLMVATVHAEDSELTVDVASITDADVEVLDVGLNVDVDQLTADAGSDKSDDAVEACFRRCGYYGGGWGRGCYSYNYNNWNSGYSNFGCYGNSFGGCYSPCYSYPSYYCVRPAYQYSCVSSPIYSGYWGCY